MKSCPNASCPFMLKFKRAGEYQDTASSCSDCGGPLVEGPTAPPASLKVPAVAVVPSDANQRLVVTVAAALAFVGLSRLPLLLGSSSVAASLSDEEGQSSLEGLFDVEGGREPLMALAAGMMPFISGFLLVEVLALVLPPLRALRTGGAVARRGLDRAAWAVGFLFLFVQLFGIVRYQAAAGALTPSPLIWGQLVLAHVAMLGLALAVSRFGLGNGFAMLMGATLLHELRIAGARQYSYLLTEMISVPVVVILVLMLGALAWAVVLLGRAGRNGTGALPTAVPFPVSSTVGWAGAAALMAMPATLGPWFPEAARVAQLFQTSEWLYTGLFLFLAFDLALVFGLLFFRPRIISELWVKWVPGVDPTSVVAAARALLPVALGLSIGATVGVPVVLMLFGMWTGVPEAATFGMLVLPLTCAIADVVDEWKALRRLGPLISVWEIQRTAEVEPIFHLLRSAGIEAHARSFLFRATQQFFAPWIPVGILVPAAREAEARALLATRLPAK